MKHYHRPQTHTLTLARRRPPASLPFRLQLSQLSDDSEVVRAVSPTLGSLYVLWSLVILVAAWGTWAASENPPFSEERLLFWLGVTGVVLATGVFVGLCRSWSRTRLLVLWILHSAVAVSALASTLDSGGVRVAPPLIALGIAGQLLGLAAISLRRS